MINRRQFTTAAGAFALSSALPLLPAAAQAAPSLRLASVKFGSVSWLLETIRAEKIDAKHGLDLKVLEVAGGPAGPIALLAGEADMIVSDWTWALRQRSKGMDLKFAPYSVALGSMMLPAGSKVTSLADLQGKRIGVAGTAVDKSWILMRAYSRQLIGKDLADAATPVYGAPPFIAEELRAGRVDACLNFWTYAARLEAEGAKTLVSVADVIKALGVDPPPALVGFVWKDKEAREAGLPVDKVLTCAAEANQVLATSDAAWERLKPLIRAKSDAELIAIRDYYRSGIPRPWSATDTASAQSLTKLLMALGDTELVGHGTRFDPELFYAARG